MLTDHASSQRTHQDRRLRRSLVEPMFAAVLVVSLSSLFRVLAPAMGVTIATVSAVLAMLTAAYLVYHTPLTLRLLRKKRLVKWFALLLIWPLATVVYAPDVDLRSIGLQVHFATLFWATIVFVQVNTWRRLHVVVAVSLLLSVPGVFASWVTPAVFEDAARLAEETVNQQGRGFGFFLQPNRASASVLLLFVVYLSGIGGRTLLSFSLVSVGMLASIGLTGSRGGLLTTLAVLGLLTFIVLREASAQGRVRLTRPLRVTATALVLLLGVSSAFIGVTSMGSRLSQGTESAELGRRLTFLTDASALGELSDETSVAARLLYQAQYVSFIADRPLPGYGLGAASAFQDAGLLLNSSHNVFLETAFAFGLLYPMLLIYSLYRLADVKHFARLPERNAGTVGFAFVFATAMLCLLSNTLLDERTFLVLLGAVVALTETKEVELTRGPSIASRPISTPSGTPARDA